MTLVSQRLGTVMGGNGGIAYIEATWDSNLEQEDGTQLDPTATMLVSQVVYQNLTNDVRHANVGGVIYEMPVGTPRTVLDIPRGQQVRMDSISYISLY